MSVCRKLPDGTIQKIAGHTILLDANASEVRQGRWNLVSTTTEWVVQNIIFTDPMPDNDYIVIIESDNQSWAMQPGPYRITNKTTTGFTLASFNGTNARGQVNMNMAGVYTAFKPVKIEGYTALQNKVNNPDDTPTIDSMNLVTSDGVARAIENASAVWKGTRAEWNALPATTKIKYDLAVITDGGLIKSVDRTTGDSDDVADLTKVWTGTQAEWDAMTQAQKNKWDKAMIQDGYYGITPAVLPVGCVQAYMGSVEPPGWLLCNGQTFDQSVYPDLYNVLGINRVPDLRESALVGAGTNNTNVIAAHDVYTVGQFKDDQTQRVTGTVAGGSIRNFYNTVVSAPTGCFVGSIAAGVESTGGHSGRSTEGNMTGFDNAKVARTGTTDHGKQTGVNWIIFAGPAQ